MEAPSFALIPSGYNTSTALVYSVIPESGVGDLTLDRSNNTATRINKDGLIESVLANVPRLNYEVNNGVVDSCPHLLLEMNSQNLITYSEDFSQYSKTNITVDDNNSTSPMGKTNASKLTDNTVNGNHRIFLSHTTSAASHTFSVFLKKGTMSTAFIRFLSGTDIAGANVDLNAGTISATAGTAKIEAFPNNWYRCSITGTAVSGTSFVYVYMKQLSGYAGTSQDMFVFGAQVEAESYATSYIPTPGSTQSRASESCTGAGDVNTFNSVEGILYVEMKRDIATDTGFRRVNINDGSADNTVRLGYSTVTNEIKGVVTIHPSTSISLVFTGLSVTEFRKMALLYKANRIELWVDGSKRAENTTTSVTFPVNTLNDLSFQQSNGSDKLRAKVKDVRYYDTDGMTPEEITNLLTQLTQ